MAKNTKTDGPFNRRGLHGMVAHHLGIKIVSGEYPANTILPSEAEFSELLKVSRTSFREAVKVLAAKGFLESRPKIGTRVLPRSNWNLMDPDVLSWHFEVGPYPGFVEELNEIRTILEPQASALAAERHTAEDLAAIENAYLAMEQAKQGSIEESTADLDFHQAIIAAARNQLLTSLGNRIEAALLGSFQLSKSTSPTAHVESLPNHKRILDAIAARDPVAAKEATDRLLRQTKYDLETVLKHHEQTKLAGDD